MTKIRGPVHRSFSSTWTTGARQLVVQEALDTTLWFALSYSEWFTPTTLVRLSHGGTTKQGDTNGDPLYLFIRLWGHHIFFGGSVSDGVVTCPIFSLGKMPLSINHARLYFFLTTLAHSPRLTIKCWIRGRFCTPKQPRPLLLVALCQWH